MWGAQKDSLESRFDCSYNVSKGFISPMNFIIFFITKKIIFPTLTKVNEIKRIQRGEKQWQDLKS